MSKGTWHFTCASAAQSQSPVPGTEASTFHLMWAFFGTPHSFWNHRSRCAKWVLLTTRCYLSVMMLHLSRGDKKLSKQQVQSHRHIEQAWKLMELLTQFPDPRGLASSTCHSGTLNQLQRLLNSGHLWAPQNSCFGHQPSTISKLTFLLHPYEMFNFMF